MKIMLRKLITESTKPYFDNIPCNGIKKKMGFSCGCSRKRNEKEKPYFIYTHRARSKGYESLDKIPLDVIKFIDSTG